MSERHDQTESVAAYLLGALDEHECESFDAHLAGCVLCHDEVERLRLAVDMLPASAPAMTPPPELKHRVMAVVQREAVLLQAAQAPGEVRARRRGAAWRGRLSLGPLGLATATAAVAIAVFAGFELRDVTRDTETRTTAARVDGAKAPGARAWIERADGAATLRMRGMPQPPRGRIYQVWLARDGAAPRPTDALFTVTTSGSATVEIPGELGRVDAVLVTHEPLGGSRAPTRAPVISATLS